ncbi:response regulator [Halobacteriovorax sp. GB3]|uniref:response regulator transcription factor n=1 Tax=Halobacteriovorax sp. GB3 TaxID=2719615 RepID=UPI0023629416|nr:response regulator [Halobacteriovorax sp. GB3]MDD0853531.1 response regulator [Halobacteriovorax sp. GB3]
MNVLIIEDDKNFATMLKMELEFKEVQCTHITSPQSIDQLKDQFDAIILDQRLESENGLDSIETLKLRWPNARLIILTGHGSISSTVSAIKCGADDYLIKPVDIDCLYAHLKGNQEEVQKALEETDMSLYRKEREHIEYVLKQCEGNITKAAKMLGLHRQSLQRKLRKYTPK